MKTLPLALPPIASFPFDADLLAILWAHSSTTEPWIFDRYIQLQVETDPNDTFLDFYDDGVRENDLLPAYFCPFIEWRRIDRERNYPPIESFVDYVKYQIDHDTYVDTPLDQYYLSCATKFNNRHFLHETLIYGYSDEDQTIKVADFYDQGKFTFCSVPYSELEASGAELTNFINLYSFRKFDYKFDIDITRTFIADFLSSQDSFAKYRISYEERNKNVVFGLEIFDYLVNVFNNQTYLNRQSYHTLYDHMRIMRLRIDYMNRIGIISDAVRDNLVNDIDFLINKTQILQNIVLKYNMTRKQADKDRINFNCVELKREEKQLFEKLVASIS